MQISILHMLYRSFDCVHARLSQYIIERQLQKAGVGRARQIPTHTTPNELHILFRLAQSCPPNARILEIGSYLGASTCYLAAGIAKYGEEVVCVDTWQNETMSDESHDTYADFLANTKPVQSLLRIIRKRSDHLLDGDLVAPFDLVFIDADHSYQAVKSDFLRVSPWLNPEGTVAFHDSLYYPGVSRVIGEALASGQWLLLGCAENLSWIRRAPSSWLTAAT